MKLLKVGYDEIREQIKGLYKSKYDSTNYIYLLQDSSHVKVEIRKKEKALSRVLSGIQVSWAEESIKRLFYEPNLFSNSQRNYLLDQSALDQRWYKTLHLAFCIAYDLVSLGDSNCIDVKLNANRANLGDDIVDHYFELRDIIKDLLTPNFEIRNKVQHGEWEYAFQPSKSKTYSQELTNKLNKENIITTTSRFTIVNTLYEMLVSLVRFRSNAFTLDSMQTPFEYHYKDNINKIRAEAIKIDNSNLESFILEIVNREIRGESYRNSSK